MGGTWEAILCRQRVLYNSLVLKSLPKWGVKWVEKGDGGYVAEGAYCPHSFPFFVPLFSKLFWEVKGNVFLEWNPYVLSVTHNFVTSP